MNLPHPVRAGAPAPDLPAAPPPRRRAAAIARALTDPGGPLALLLAALLALALAHWIFSTPFMRGLTPFWSQQDNDIAQYLSGYNAFVREAWHWPLLRVESINAPEGTLATFLDTIPLYAMLLKLWQHGPDTPFRNPYALWISLCFVLQGAGAWWICREAQLRSWLALAALTLLLAAFPPLSFRINHIGLMSQWLLLFGLAAYLRGHRLGRLASGAWLALLLAAFYIHSYLFCMLSALFAADLWRPAPGGGLRRAAATALAAVALLGLSMFVTMLPLSAGGGTAAWGFGFYSMNLLGPFAGGNLLQFPHPVAHDGQGEGYAYTGIFVLMAAAYAVQLRRRADPSFWRRHRALAVALALLTAYALSNMVYLGQTELFHLDLPRWTGKLTSVMRSSGRFFWPVGYVVTAFTVVTLARHLRPRRAAVVLLCVLSLHFWDLTPHRQMVRQSVAVGAAERVHEPLWSAFLGAETRALQVYPPFGCDKGPAIQTLLPTMMYAVKHQMTISTGYVARIKESCDNYAAEIAASMSPATAFVFIKNDFAGREQVEQLLGGQSAATCIEADFAWLCKRTQAVAMEKQK
jgi:hypothetical protein